MLALFVFVAYCVSRGNVAACNNSSNIQVGSKARNLKGDLRSDKKINCVELLHFLTILKDFLSLDCLVNNNF